MDNFLDHDFIKDLNRLNLPGSIKSKVSKIDGSLIFLHLNQLFDLWAASKEAELKGKSWLLKASMRQSFASLPGFVTSNHLKLLNGRVRRCLVFYRKEAPRSILRLTGAKK